MHEGGFKVRGHVKVRKYFHIYFPLSSFPCLFKFGDILFVSGVQGQGSIFLGKPEKLLFHRTVLINRNLPALLTSQGPVWGRSRINLPNVTKCEGLSEWPPWLPQAKLLTLICHLALLSPRPFQKARSKSPSKEGNRRRQTRVMTFMIHFMVSKPLEAYYFLWFL